MWSFILGKYHHPKEEVRIFMFADIKSSTTIAEKLGNVRYFQLLNDFFDDITDPIIYTRGEIYQYVGDEVVVSWSMKNGVPNANCLKCFFEMRQALSKKAKTYEEKYGLVPEFKAGLHVGEVTTGEIGAIKKDIVYSGDVLNSAARIQALCNEYHQKLMISEQLWKQLDEPPQYKTTNLGQIELRGKEAKLNLVGIEAEADQAKM